MSRLLLACGLFVFAAPSYADEGPVTVTELDLTRYMGTWYEVAAMPNFPQRGCTDTIVHYRLREGGGFELRNTCWKKGKYKPYHGTAKPVDPGHPGRFYAKFVLFLGSDYWIVDLDPGYRWAAVGTRNRKQLWVISREPAFDGPVYEAVLRHAAAKGFDVGRLVRTVRTGKTPPADPWGD